MIVGGFGRNLRQIIERRLWTKMTPSETAEFYRQLEGAMDNARTVRRRRYYATWYLHVVEGHDYPVARALALKLHPPGVR